MYQKFKYLFLIVFFFSLTDSYAQIDGYYRIDKHAKFIAKRQPRDYRTIARRLVKPANTKMERVRAIYTWMSHYFQYNVDKWRKSLYSTPVSVQEIVNSKMGICGDLARVFKAMCDEVGINCYYVVGSTHARFLYIFPKLGMHAWNVVEVDGDWYHIDATWGTGTVVKKKFLKKRIGRGKPWRQYKRNTTTSHTLRWYFWKHPTSNYFAPSSAYFNKTHCADLAFMQLQDNVMHRFEFVWKNKHKTIKKYQPYSYKDSINKYANHQYFDKRIFELENQLPVIARRRFPLSKRYLDYADSCTFNILEEDSIPQLEFYKTCYKRSIKYQFGNGLFFFAKHAFVLSSYWKGYEFGSDKISKLNSEFLEDRFFGLYLGAGVYYISTDFFIRPIAGILKVSKQINKLEKAQRKERD